MTNLLRIGIADDQPSVRELLVRMVTDLGHEVVFSADTGQSLIEQCRQAKPDLVIADVRMPELDGLEASQQINLERPTPVVLVSAYHDLQLIERAKDTHILAYLVKPFKQEDLASAIILARNRFEEFELLRMQAEHYRQALDDRKLIERAKGILMARWQLTEPEAFRRLQRLASSSNMKLVAAARSVVSIDQSSE
jgi:response regulator NasT